MQELKVVKIPVTRLRQNATLIFPKDRREAVLIDPGGEAEKILAAIDQQQLKVKQIWITHGHFDHVGAAMYLKDILKVPILGPSIEDRFLLDRVEETAALYTADKDILNVKVDRFLANGDILNCGGCFFEVIHSPGHTPGHVVFYSKSEDFIIMGDVLFKGSIGRTDLEGGNHQQLLHSIKKKILPLGNNVSFICGHGPDSTIGDERLNNPFLKND